MRALVALTSCSQQGFDEVMRPHVIFARLLQVHLFLLTGCFFDLSCISFGGFVLVFPFSVVVVVVVVDAL